MYKYLIIAYSFTIALFYLFIYTMTTQHFSSPSILGFHSQDGNILVRQTDINAEGSKGPALSRKLSMNTAHREQLRKARCSSNSAVAEFILL